MLLNPLKVYVPQSLSEAIDLYGRLESVRIQAGGTFLLNSLKLLKRNGVKTPEHVISLRKIPELVGIKSDAKELTIQSMTTITDIFESPLLEDNFSVLRTVCRNISTTPIRNMATVGGNLTCRYTWTEMPAVMIALDAKLHFIGKDGKEEILAAEDFFKNAAKTDKILVKIVIPRDKTSVVAYQRVKKTVHIDIPMLSLCVKTNIVSGNFTNTRIGVNNCVNFGQRDLSVENFLNGKSCTPETVEQALDHMDKNIYDNRSSDYKKYMFKVSMKNALLEIVKKAKG